MEPQPQQPGGGGLVLIVLALWYAGAFKGCEIDGGGSAPVRVPGLTALYIEETDNRSSLSADQHALYTAKGPDSVKGFLDANAHKTEGHPDARFFDQHDDVSRCLPVMGQLFKRWEAAGKVVPWRHVTNGKRFYEGAPSGVADELAKLKTLAK